MVARYTCEARHAASVKGMRTALSVKWKHHVVQVCLHADSANNCAASIESWSQPLEAVKTRSAVVASSAQLQGSTGVPNVKRAAAHCLIVT